MLHRLLWDVALQVACMVYVLHEPKQIEVDLDVHDCCSASLQHRFRLTLGVTR